MSVAARNQHESHENPLAPAHLVSVVNNLRYKLGVLIVSYGIPASAINDTVIRKSFFSPLLRTALNYLIRS